MDFRSGKTAVCSLTSHDLLFVFICSAAARTNLVPRPGNEIKLKYSELVLVAMENDHLLSRNKEYFSDKLEGGRGTSE